LGFIGLLLLILHLKAVDVQHGWHAGVADGGRNSDREQAAALPVDVVQGTACG